MDIAEFLLAQLADDAAVTQDALRRAIDAPHIPARTPQPDADGHPGSFELRFEPEFILLDIAAKRTIVEDYIATCRIRDAAQQRVRDAYASGRLPGKDWEEWNRANREASILEPVLRRLAEPYGPGCEEGSKS